MRRVRGLEAAREILREAVKAGAASSTNSCSPLAGEPNRPSSDLEGGDKLREFARQLRKTATPWERILWRLLKSDAVAPYKFRRQAPIDHYIADFVNYEKRLIIELDGSQHVDSRSDQKRDGYLREQGFHILRFWNNELDVNPEGVIARIVEVLRSTPHRNAQERFDSPAGGEWESSPTDGEAIQLCSPPFAACHAGVNYWWTLLEQVRSEFPNADFTFTLCCGDDPAIAHDALRMGFTQVLCDCHETVFAELQAIAASYKAEIKRTENE